MNSQPNDGFEWVQAAGGPALVCVPLRPLANHLFTTRDWALGSPAGGADADWQPVAASLGVDAAHLAGDDRAIGHENHRRGNVPVHRRRGVEIDLDAGEIFENVYEFGHGFAQADPNLEDVYFSNIATRVDVNTI
jgi:hypothetical protein